MVAIKNNSDVTQKEDIIRRDFKGNSLTDAPSKPAYILLNDELNTMSRKLFDEVRSSSESSQKGSNCTFKFLTSTSKSQMLNLTSKLSVNKIDV